MKQVIKLLPRRCYQVKQLNPSGARLELAAEDLTRVLHSNPLPTSGLLCRKRSELSEFIEELEDAVKDEPEQSLLVRQLSDHLENLLEEAEAEAEASQTTDSLTPRSLLDRSREQTVAADIAYGGRAER